MSVEYKVITDFQGTGFDSVAEIEKGNMNDLELLYMAYGSLHATSLFWAKLALRKLEDNVEYPYNNIVVWANIMVDMMQDIKEKMAQEGLVTCSCEENEEEVDDEDEEEEDINKPYQSYLKFSTDWSPEQLN